MNFLGSSKPLLLIHDAMPMVNRSDVFDIMLSPQFYTLKREDIPVRYHFQAKKLASSILENLLPEDGNYEHYVFKEENLWAFVAYDPGEIGRFLQTRGISTEQVSKLYFAQQVSEKFNMPVLLDENTALGSVQHTATVLPSILLPKETRYQDFDETFKPGTGTSFGLDAHSIIGRKEAWTISAIFLIFALMFAVEGMRYRQVVTTMQEKVALLLQDYPALQSQYARENIAKKYRKIDREERQKREILKGLSRLVLPGVEVESLLMGRKQYSITLKCPDEKSVIRVHSLAKEKQYKASRVGSENIVKIEGSL
ncbi:MAG: hypothetical protein U9R26_07070 [Campylobacterota bacterium]|nr:hypothetical protein [Campylobacterota bacterium]